MSQKETDTIRRLRQEYDHISVPPEAKARVLAGIRQAKQENHAIPRQKRGGISMKIMKNTGITAAAAVMAIAILTNVNPSIANAMEQIPVIGSIARVVTFRTYEDQTNHFEADIQIPQISEGNTDAADIAANKSIEEYAQELIAMYEHDLAASNGEGNYSLESSYQVVTDNEQYLCIRIDTTLVMASGTQFVKTFTIDKQTGSIVALNQLLTPEGLTAASDNIKKQMAEQMAADDSIVYFYESDMPDMDFKGLKGDESFYFNENKELVIAFDEYEVAPGYMGAVEFTIPKEIFS